MLVLEADLMLAARFFDADFFEENCLHSEKISNPKR